MSEAAKPKSLETAPAADNPGNPGVDHHLNRDAGAFDGSDGRDSEDEDDADSHTAGSEAGELIRGEEGTTSKQEDSGQPHSNQSQGPEVVHPVVSSVKGAESAKTDKNHEEEDSGAPSDKSDPGMWAWTTATAKSIAATAAHLARATTTALLRPYLGLHDTIVTRPLQWLCAKSLVSADGKTSYDIDSSTYRYNDMSSHMISRRNYNSTIRGLFGSAVAPSLHTALNVGLLSAAVACGSQFSSDNGTALSKGLTDSHHDPAPSIPPSSLM